MRKAFGKQDFWAGVMFAAWGQIGLWLSSGYPVGTALRMGPGYLPRLICWILIGLGVILIVRALWMGGAKTGRFAPRPLVLVSMALAAFALLIERAGLPLAVLATAVVGAAGAPRVHVREAMMVGVVLALGATLVFVVALRLPMTLAPFAGF